MAVRAESVRASRNINFAEIASIDSLEYSQAPFGFAWVVSFMTVSFAKDRVAPTYCSRCSRAVIVDLLYLQGVFLYEIAARLDFFAHEDTEHQVGFVGVL